MNRRIMLVEDDRLLQCSISQLLMQEGYEVEKASNYKDACYLMQLHRENAFDLVILDIMLPDGSGFALCEKLRKLSAMPIIFLTACDDEESIVKGLDLGADDYIVKPFRKQELLSRLRAHLRRQIINKKADRYTSGDLVIQLHDHQVKKQKIDIMLRPVEYQLLLCFLQNPQIILNRDLLLEKIWDENENFVDGTTLTVQISRLRAALGKCDGMEYISTIRGFGYRWNFEVDYGD